MVSALSSGPLQSFLESPSVQKISFAGYKMALHYGSGVLAEHHHTRQHASLFDISHMGQIQVQGLQARQHLETLVPADLCSLRLGQSRYTQFLSEEGTILDDLILTYVSQNESGEETLLLVVNAANKNSDFEHVRHALPFLNVTLLEDRVLLSLQGPQAASILESFIPNVSFLPFMSFRAHVQKGEAFWIFRSGYTGEDGFEISLPRFEAEFFVSQLLQREEVQWAGLGARDSLRLEAGLCLYGHDLNTTITPLDAGLSWSISKRRWEEGGFLGAQALRIAREKGPSRRRVGLKINARSIAREGCEIRGKNVGQEDPENWGWITSGLHSPTLDQPIAMGYIKPEKIKEGGRVYIVVRGRELEAVLTSLPFVPHRYYRQG